MEQVAVEEQQVEASVEGTAIVQETMEPAQEEQPPEPPAPTTVELEAALSETRATPEEVEASLAQARQIVERIRTHIESQLAEQRVPTGAPIRSAQDLSSLSPQEKIAYALSQQEQGR